MTTKLFIGNLPDFCRREDLLNKFEKFGNVVEFDIVSNFGFAHYESPDEAKAAADAMNGTTFNDSTLRVEVSHSKVRQKPGMGDREGCFRCGKEGHWSKDCPRGPRRPPKREYRNDPYDEDPLYRDPYDPYYRSRYAPPPPSYRRYDPYSDPYDRSPLPSRDPYLRERVAADPYARERVAADPYARERVAADPYARERVAADPYARERVATDPYAYYYDRRSPPPSASASASAASAGAASARRSDPYAKDPYGKDPYGKDPYGKDPYAKDPYAAARTADARDRYNDYYDRRRTYSADPQSAAYSKSATGPSSAGYGHPASSGYSSVQSSGYSSTQSGYSSAQSGAYSSAAQSGGYSQAPSSSYSAVASSSYSPGSKLSSSTVQSSRVPGPY